MKYIRRITTYPCTEENGFTEKITVESGNIEEREILDIDCEYGDTILEVSPGVFIQVSTSEWGDLKIVPKPSDWID